MKLNRFNYLTGNTLNWKLYRRCDRIEQKLIEIWVDSGHRYTVDLLSAHHVLGWNIVHEFLEPPKSLEKLV